MAREDPLCVQGVRPRTRPRGNSEHDAGLAVITVLGAAFALTLFALLLVQMGMSQYNSTARSIDGKKAQAAAEAGLENYLGLLVQRTDLDKTMIVNGEATRSGNTVCGDADDITAAHASLAQTSWFAANAVDWWFPCGFDNWYPVDPDDWPMVQAGTAGAGDDIYMYSVAVQPRRGNDLVVQVAGARSDQTLNQGAVRVIEALVRPSSFAKYQMISQGDIVVNPGTVTEGEIFSAQTVYHSGQVRNRVIANDVAGCTDPGGCAGFTLPSGDWRAGATWVLGSKGRLAAGACGVTEAFFDHKTKPVGSCHDFDDGGAAPDFSNVRAAREALRDKVIGGSGLYLPALSAPDRGYRLVLSGDQITAYVCRERVIPAPQQGARGSASDPPGTLNYFEDSIDCNAAPVSGTPYSQGGQFFVYSPMSLLVEGFVTARGNMLSDQDIYIGGDIYYGTDDNESDSDLDSYVLGLHARSEIIIPAWAKQAGVLHIRAAAIAEEGSYHDSYAVDAAGFPSSGCTIDASSWNGAGKICAKDTLDFFGSWYSFLSPGVVMFANRQYSFYPELEYLAPPLWPNASSEFDVVRWIERHTDYHPCNDYRAQSGGC